MTSRIESLPESRATMRSHPNAMPPCGGAPIRDVIAFPKTGGGFDPLTSAPAPITPAQRKEAGVDAVPEKADDPAASVASSPAASAKG